MKWVAVIVCAGSLCAQAPLRGPVEGFTFDAPTRSFRAVRGALGSAMLGPALISGFDFGSVAPRRGYGIAFAEGKARIVDGLDSDGIGSAPLDGEIATPETVAWSGDGSVAVLYSRSGNWVQAIRGLPGSPAVSSSFRVDSLAAVAVDRRGEHIAIGIAGEQGGIFQLEAGQNLTPLLSASSPVGLSFSDDGQTLYAIDGRQLVQLNVADRSSQTFPLDGLAEPTAIASQGNSLYAAGRSDRLLVAYDVQTHEATAKLQLSFTPNALEPLGANSFLLGARLAADDPLWSFTATSQPQVYFVPPTPLVPREDSSR